MTAIEAFQRAKNNLDYAKAWASIIGQPYRGGGGGVGEVVRTKVRAEIYSQAYDGAKNYHDMPQRLAEYVSSAVKVKFDELLADSLAAMEAEVKQLAAKAATEHAELLAAAGISQAEAA